MRRNFAVLKFVEEDRPINRESDRQFFSLVERSLLLVLYEQGLLNDRQFRWAEERLEGGTGT